MLKIPGYFFKLKTQRKWTKNGLIDKKNFNHNQRVEASYFTSVQPEVHWTHCR
jgi:hypothetical protein